MSSEPRVIFLHSCNYNLLKMLSCLSFRTQSYSAHKKSKIGKTSHSQVDQFKLHGVIIFFAQSVRIKLASPQAARLRVFFNGKKQLYCSSMNDLIKDALLIGLRQNPSTQRDSNPQPLPYGAIS